MHPGYDNKSVAQLRIAEDKIWYGISNKEKRIKQYNFGWTLTMQFLSKARLLINQNITI